MADAQAVIDKCVEDIWSQFDKDGNGCLDKEETKKFVEATMKEIGDASHSEEDFDACFQEFDTNGDGTISKDEMANFIKKVAGL